MAQIIPPTSLRKKINSDGAKSSGSLLHGWARRTIRGMPSTPRQLRALINYMPTAVPSVFNSLGGQDTIDWAKSTIDELGMFDTTPELSEDEITVLGLPYYGPIAGKDSQSQFFSPQTEFFDGIIPNPPVYYTHGTSAGFEPEPIGKVTKRWYDQKGGWFSVELDKSNPRYPQIIDAYHSGNLRASSGAVPASYNADDKTGHINTWLVGELSLVDLNEGFVPVNAYAIAKAEEVVFDDYYGEPVVMNWIEALKEQLTELVSLIKQADTLPEYVNKAEEEIKTMADEKCATCDENETLATEIKTELEQVGCVRCKEALNWVRSMVKAGKLPVKEAFPLLEEFKASDDTFDAVKAEWENKPLVPQKAALFIAGGSNTKAEDTIDEAFMNKQRRIAGLIK